MKGGASANDIRVRLEPAATLGLNILQIVKRTEDLIGKWFIGKRPQAFSRLQLGRMGWQKEQMNPFGNGQIATLVPARLIQNQENPLVRSSALFLSKGGQSKRKSRRIDRWHEQPAGFSALWLDKAIEVHPLIARADYSPNPASFACPDPAQDWFETDAVFVLTPHFNAGFRICLAQLLNLLREFF